MNDKQTERMRSIHKPLEQLVLAVFKVIGDDMPDTTLTEAEWQLYDRIMAACKFIVAAGKLAEAQLEEKNNERNDKT